MLNFLNKEGGFLKKFLLKQYRNYKHEDIGYLAAFLARSREKLSEITTKIPILNEDELTPIYEKIFDELNVLSIDEHWEIAKSDATEQIFYIFQSLIHNSRNKELVFNKRLEMLSNITELVDPDKFPIFSQVEKPEDEEMVSLWSHKPKLLQEVEKELGYHVYVKPSTLEHHDAGNGVFLSCIEKRFVLPGTLLALVPGVIFGIYDQYPEKNEKLKELTYFKRYDGTYIDFSEKIPYPFEIGRGLMQYHRLMTERRQKKESNDKLVVVDGELVNPFAVAHKINHPPKGILPNVVLIDLIIPNHFFTIDYLRYLPNVKFSTEKTDFRKLKEHFHNDCFHCLAAFSTKIITDGEELFQDYLYYILSSHLIKNLFNSQSNLFHIDHPCDWLVKPPPVSPYFYKYSYENQFSMLSKLVDMYLLKDEKDVYAKFERMAAHDQDFQENDDYIKRKIEKNEKNL